MFTLPVDLDFRQHDIDLYCSFGHIAHNLRYYSDRYASAIFSHSSCPCALLLMHNGDGQMLQGILHLGAILKLDSLLGGFTPRRIALVTHSIECWVDPSFNPDNTKKEEMSHGFWGLNILSLVVHPIASGRYMEIYFCIIFIFIIAAPFDTRTRLVLNWYTKN